MRKVHCAYCGKAIKEGSVAVRRKGWTGFYCDFKCLAYGMNIAKVVTVTDELVEEDKESSGHGWDE